MAGQNRDGLYRGHGSVACPFIAAQRAFQWQLGIVLRNDEDRVCARSERWKVDKDNRT